VLETAQIGFWDFNPITRELIWSDRCKELFGLSPTTPVTYELFLEGLHPEDRDETDRVVQEALRPGSTGQYAIVYRTVGLEDGQLRCLRANGRAFFNENGIAHRFIGTVTDITESQQYRQELERQTEELQRSNNELRQSNESLRQFAHIASHDLQEPLRKIQAFTDVLQSQFQDNLSEGERDMTQRIQKSAHRMQLLVKDLLTYSQITTQRDPFIPVDLNNVAEDVVSDLEIAITEKGATVAIGQLPTVLGSASRLRQLVQNLIANALKFIQPTQSPVVSVSARLAKPDELPDHLRTQPNPFWLLSIVDNGLGFNEKYKDRIFQPFQRLHTLSQYSGTGIGLAICQRVSESHGGAIDASSQPGKGSTFKVFLPVFSDSQDAWKRS
jgi:PAS domain S-box-containing protein